MDRIIIKPRLYRLAKAGKIQLMGGGRYSTVTATVTQEVKDKKREVKNSHLSLTQTLPSALPLLCRCNRTKPWKTSHRGPQRKMPCASLVLTLPSAPRTMPCASLI